MNWFNCKVNIFKGIKKPLDKLRVSDSSIENRGEKDSLWGAVLMGSVVSTVVAKIYKICYKTKNPQISLKGKIKIQMIRILLYYNKTKQVIGVSDLVPNIVKLFYSTAI